MEIRDIYIVFSMVRSRARLRITYSTIHAGGVALTNAVDSSIAHIIYTIKQKETN